MMPLCQFVRPAEKDWVVHCINLVTTFRLEVRFLFAGVISRVIIDVEASDLSLLRLKGTV